MHIVSDSGLGCTYIFQPERSPLGLQSEWDRMSTLHSVSTSGSHWWGVTDPWWVHRLSFHYFEDVKNLYSKYKHAVLFIPYRWITSCSCLWEIKIKKIRLLYINSMHSNVPAVGLISGGKWGRQWALNISYAIQKWASPHRVLAYGCVSSSTYNLIQKQPCDWLRYVLKSCSLELIPWKDSCCIKLS